MKNSFSNLFRNNAQQRYLLIGLIILISLAIRCWVIYADPFLYSWDERFHANVAKNMLVDPFKPVLRLDPIKPFDYTQWCCNVVWLHKPPLFLWKIAVSIKIFGANVWAVRLPSLIMSLGILFLGFKMGCLLHGRKLGVLLLVALSFSMYQIEQMSGNLSTDHNDVAFMFYMFGGFYFLIKHRLKDRQHYLWLFAIAAGLAAMVKGPQALALFVLFGLFKVSDLFCGQPLKIVEFIKAFGVYFLISAPWQIYTSIRFPKESAFERAYNWKHIWEVAENHGGDMWWHIEYFDHLYGPYAWPFLLLGVIAIFRSKNKKILHHILMAFCAIMYGLYSLVVKTKMPGYIFILAPFIYYFMMRGIEYTAAFSSQLIKNKTLKKIIYISILFICTSFFTFQNLRPLEMYQFHSHDKTTNYYSWDGRKKKKQNTLVYKSLRDRLPQDCVIFNAPPYEGVEIMFHSGHNAYQYLEEDLLKQLNAEGKCVAYFRNVSHQAVLPWAKDDPNIIWIDDELIY